RPPVIERADGLRSGGHDRSPALRPKRSFRRGETRDSDLRGVQALGQARQTVGFLRFGQRGSESPVAEGDARSTVRARSSKSSRSRAFLARNAARSNSRRASAPRPSLDNRSPRTLGNR